MSKSETNRKGRLDRALTWLFRATHGDRPDTAQILITQLGALAVAATAAVVATWWLPGISPLQLLLLFLVAYDLAGGAISNVSEPVDRRYAEKSIKLRLWFLVGHCLYPILIGAAFGAGMGLYAGVCYLAALVGGSVVLVVPGRHQAMVALAYVVLGLVVMSLWPAPLKPLAWFGPLLLIKLAYSFPVTHFERDR